MLVEFSFKLVYSIMCGRIFKFMFTFLENSLNLGIFIDVPPPHSKLSPKFLSSHPRQRKLSIPWGIFSKICFLQQQKVVEETMICFIKIQSENMKMAWNTRLFIICMICSFFKCDDFTVIYPLYTYYKIFIIKYGISFLSFLCNHNTLMLKLHHKKELPWWRVAFYR